jgi:predicted nucleic acid-binding protein
VILVDTNVVSELTRPTPKTRVVTWLEDNEPALAIPTVALAELRYGIARLPAGRRRSSLLRFWETTCDQFRGRICSFDQRAAKMYGDVAAAAERAGRRLNVQDGQIAAIALVHRMRVATRNVRDFEAAGVGIVNPWE